MDNIVTVEFKKFNRQTHPLFTLIDLSKYFSKK
jgi:hypothetical protein